MSQHPPRGAHRSRPMAEGHHVPAMNPSVSRSISGARNVPAVRVWCYVVTSVRLRKRKRRMNTIGRATFSAFIATPPEPYMQRRDDLLELMKLYDGAAGWAPPFPPCFRSTRADVDLPQDVDKIPRRNSYNHIAFQRGRFTRARHQSTSRGARTKWVVFGGNT